LHNHADHSHQPVSSGKTFIWALILTVTFAVIEAIAGWLSGSLALLSDAGHMVSDATALGLASLAAWVAVKPPSAQHSYGYGRAEVVAALINSLFMIGIVVVIVVAAVDRMQTPRPVIGSTVMWVAAIGLFINMLVAYVLSRGERTLNTRGALLHVMGDLLGSVAALIAGAVIYFTGWTPIDPILSLVICALILYSSLNLLREVFQVIMEGVPSSIDLNEVGLAMATIADVNSVHDLHIWTLSSGRVALSAHLVVSELEKWPLILDQQSRMLKERFAVEHITLQPETVMKIIQPISLIK
jgi:cobalt-zinc-cadmium efflux system protein